MKSLIPLARFGESETLRSEFLRNIERFVAVNDELLSHTVRANHIDVCQELFCRLPLVGLIGFDVCNGIGRKRIHHTLSCRSCTIIIEGVRRRIALIISRHLATIHRRSEWDDHFVAIRFASDKLEAVLHLRLNVRWETESVLVGEVNQVAIVVVNLITDCARAVYDVGYRTRAGGCGVVVAVRLILVHKVAPLPNIGITDRHFAVVVDAIRSLWFALEWTVKDGRRGFDAIIYEADAWSLRIASHIGLSRIDVGLCGRYPVVAVIAHKELVVGNKHTIHLEEFAQVELGCITHLLGHMQIVSLSVGYVSSHNFAIAIGEIRIVWSCPLLDGVLTKHLEECGIEVRLVSLSVEIKVELEVETRLFPDAHSEPAFILREVLERVCHLCASSCGNAMQEDIHIGEEVVAHLSRTYDVEASLMVVPYLVRRSPDCPTTRSQRVVVHHSRDGAVLVVSSVCGGIHIAVSDGECVPDVAEPACKVFLEAHQVLLTFHEVVPDTHQSFCFASSANSVLHEVGHHSEDNAFAFEVNDCALVEQFLVEECPVLIGHSTRIVKVALQLSSLDMNLGCRIVGKVFLRIVELIEDVDGACLAQQDGVETCVEIRDSTCLMIARTVAVNHDFSLQGAFRIGFLVDIDVDNVSHVANDSSRSGEFAESVAHACIFVRRHLLVMAINIIVIANTEELLEGFSRITCG